MCCKCVANRQTWSELTAAKEQQSYNEEREDPKPSSHRSQNLTSNCEKKWKGNIDGLVIEFRPIRVKKYIFEIGISTGRKNSPGFAQAQK